MRQSSSTPVSVCCFATVNQEKIMEKSIEFAIRFTKNALLQADQEFSAALDLVLAQVAIALQYQRDSYRRIAEIWVENNSETAVAGNSIELFSRTKEAREIIDPLAKGIECGIRIDLRALEATDSVFCSVIDECLAGYRKSILEQRLIFIRLNEKQTIELYAAMKGVEMYFGICYCPVL